MAGETPVQPINQRGHEIVTRLTALEQLVAGLAVTGYGPLTPGAATGSALGPDVLVTGAPAQIKTGLLTAPLMDHGGSVCNVASYGLVPGVDCSPYLRDLLAASANKAVELYFPVPRSGGDYRFDSAVDVDTTLDFITMHGGGVGLYRSNPGGYSGSTFGGAVLRRNFNGPLFNVTARYARIYNLGFDGDRDDGITGPLLNLAATQQAFVDDCGFLRIDDFGIVFTGGNAPASRLTHNVFTTGVVGGVAVSSAAVQFPDNWDGTTLYQNGDYTMIDCHAYGGFAIVAVKNTLNLNMTACTSGGTITWGLYPGKVSFVANRLAVHELTIHGTDHSFTGNQISGAEDFTLAADSTRCYVGGNVYSGGRRIVDLGVANRVIDADYLTGGAWVAFTPVVTQGVTPTTGVPFARWTRDPGCKTVRATLQVVFTSAGTAASPIELQLPAGMPAFADATAGNMIGTGYYLDSGVAFLHVVAQTTGTQRRVRFINHNTGGDMGTGGAGGPAIALGDKLSIELMYEGA